MLHVKTTQRGKIAAPPKRQPINLDQTRQRLLDAAGKNATDFENLRSYPGYRLWVKTKYNLYKNILLVLNSEIGKKTIKLNEMWDVMQLGERDAKGNLKNPPRYENGKKMKSKDNIVTKKNAKIIKNNFGMDWVYLKKRLGIDWKAVKEMINCYGISYTEISNLE